MTADAETGRDARSRGNGPVPAAAKWLGGGGAIPFAGCAFIATFGPPDWGGLAAAALGFYGAVILSFLGGIQWGMAIKESSAVSPVRLSLSVVPSLIAWVGLMLPLQVGLLIMAVAFALVLYIDLRASHAGEAPAWFPKLRIPLSVVAVASLVIGSLG